MAQSVTERFFQDGAFVKTGKNEFLVFEGPFTFEKYPSTTSPSLYLQDFFLESKRPWVVAEKFLQLKSHDFHHQISNYLSPKTENLAWEKPSKYVFEKGYDSLRTLFKTGKLEKGVVFSRQQAEFNFGPRTQKAFLKKWLKKLKGMPENSIPYGFWHNGEGLLGSTPEILFEQSKDGSVLSMAVAGTRLHSSSSSKELLNGQKDRVEHQKVIDGVVEQLKKIGHCTVGETTVRNFGSLDHLHAMITVTPNNSIGFDELVTLLHPTPALGFYPKNIEGQNWLKSLEPLARRKRFGAPFGFRLTNGSGKCLVAIRNFQFTQSSLEIFSGCGVVEKSDFSSEWAECYSKLDTIKQTWGLS